MKPSLTVVKPQGRLDASGVRPLETELQEHLDAGRVHLLVDMSQVVYVSSIGLRMFLSIMRSARRHGGALQLCQLTPHVLGIFQLAGFDRVISIASNCRDAENEYPLGEI